MKPIFKFLLLTVSVLCLTSCEDVIQVKLDEGSKLYVIDAFVNDQRTSQTIRVINNDSYFSAREAPPVAGALVVLKDLTANKTYNFNYTGNGNYVFNTTDADTMCKVGHQYELNVTIDGMTYSSLTVQKRTAKIDSISAEVIGESGFGGGRNDSTYFCNLFAREKVDNNTDYYLVKTFRNDTLFFSASDINVCIDGTGGAVTEAGGIDSLEFTPPATLLSFKQYKKGDVCKVEVHSISRETYYFFIQAAAQISNGGLFATTPENVKTNITTPVEAKTKAVGWFNVATVTSKTKVVQ